MDYPTKAFSSAASWRSWLAKNHDAQGVWIRFYKKASGKKTITYAEALDEALCYGWIDGQAKKYDEESWLQKFTPRRKRSMWSKRNTENAMRLIREKRMTSAGVHEIERAKADGRWEQAYHASSTMTIPAEFMDALKKDKKALSFFKTLNKTNTYAIAWRLQTAKKPETRKRRMQAILVMLANGETFH